MQFQRLAAAAVLCVATAALPASCAPAPRMCTTESDCGNLAACVAGRCVLHAASPAIATARRLVYTPVDQGWVRRGDEARGTVATLGRGDGALVFLRFAVPLAPEATVVEAFVLLDLAPAVDAETAEVVLHAARVEGAWDGRTLSWARQPRVVEVGAALTTVKPAAGGLVRLDARPLVERWRRGDVLDGGIAIVTRGASATGLSVALAPLDVPADRADPVLAPEPAVATQPPSAFEPRVVAASGGDPRRQVSGPRLELYVR